MQLLNEEYMTYSSEVEEYNKALDDPSNEHMKGLRKLAVLDNNSTGIVSGMLSMHHDCVRIALSCSIHHVSVGIPRTKHL